jgi:Rad3-related DNA helicase
MVGITASSAALAVSATMDKTRVVQTRRDAEQAQNVADNLRQKANDANRTAKVSQDNARELAERSNQLIANYVQAQSGLSTEPRVLNAVAATRVYSSPQPTASLLLPVVVNTQGQATGQLVNVAA